MSNVIELFHGSDTIVETPDLTVGREHVDFGRGFYLSPDFTASAKWACQKSVAICNHYELDLRGLRVYEFALDELWLNFVIKNREPRDFWKLGLTDEKFEALKDCDVLIGAIADDKLFQTLEMFVDGFISAEKAITIMNCMNHGAQIVLKTDAAVQNLNFLGYDTIVGREKAEFLRQYREDGREAARRTAELLRELV